MSFQSASHPLLVPPAQGELPGGTPPAQSEFHSGTASSRLLLRTDTAPAGLGATPRHDISSSSAGPPPLRRISSFRSLSAKAESAFWWYRLALLLAYLAVGVLLGYHQGWDPLFSLYFSVETLTTVGYGDFHLQDASPNFQLCVAFFVLMGVVVMGSALSVIFNEAYEKQRRAVERMMKDASESNEQRRCTLSRRCGGRVGTLGEASTIYKHARHGLRKSLQQCVAAFLGILVAGAAIVGSIEGWDWRKSFYWSCVTFTSVGYGDVVPDSSTSRAATMLLMAVGVVVVGSCAGFFGSYVSFLREAKLRQEVLTQFGTELTGEELEALARGEEIKRLDLCSSDQHISRSEFVLFMLTKLGRVEEEELRACQAAFDCLDVTKTGTLTQQDLQRHETLRELRRQRQQQSP